MTPTRDDSSLLKALLRLYSRLMNLLMKSSPATNRGHSAASASLDIVSPLSECVDKLCSNTPENREGTSGAETGVAGNAASEHASTVVSVASSKDGQGDLSVYLQEAHRHSVVCLDTGEKLMHSTWDHIHTSMRVARQGDVKTARLHVELASSALREAERYLSIEVFSSFAEEVMGTLNEINGRFG